ncbi:hypothetical protein [Paludifilum halophilum]|uniref:Uncharacterized protein n=1 Tax=Paludifilum halophilum TaxID=1642702 RepID=A0A235B218_9BACL|nr:hypothetical protein [Paludifilum halophilum]OYD06348.1 hypothetical protein CHM34_16675 [Paludifilum halophilum]
MKVHVDGLVQYELLFHCLDLEEPLIQGLSSILELDIDIEEFQQLKRQGWKEGGYYLTRHPENPDQFFLVDFGNNSEFDYVVVRCEEQYGEAVKRLMLDIYNQGEGPDWDFGRKKKDLKDKIAGPFSSLPELVREYQLRIDYVKIYAPIKGETR